MRIPGFSNKSSPPEALPSASIASSAPARFAPLHVRPSTILWRIQLATHSLAGLLLLWALIPWVAIAWIWLLALIIGVCGLVASAVYLRSRRIESAGVLRLTETGWCWQSDTMSRELVLTGELVVWAGLIILPFKERAGRRRKTLVLLPDCCTADDLRRLRVWLRTMLPRP